MILIKNAHIKPITAPDFQGDLLVKDGKIAALGKNLEIPKDCEIIDGSNCLLTPGLIDGHTHIGILEEGIRSEGDDVNEMTDPVTPHMRAIDGINPRVREFAEALAGGVTSAMTGPGSANPIGGQFALIKLWGERIDSMVIKSPAAMKIAFGENPKRVYGGQKKTPMTRMGTAAVIRETLYKAKDYFHKKESGESADFNLKMEAFIPVFKKEIPLKAHAHQADDIFTGIRIAKEFDLPMTLDHCTEGHLIAEELKKENYPIYLGPTMGGKSKYELRNISFETARIFEEAGIKFAIITDAYVIPLKHLALCAGLAVGAGLSEETAWKAITINPAEFLGVEDRIGSLEEGKDADLVLFCGNPLLDITARAILTIVDGKIVHSDTGLNIQKQ